MSKIVAPIRVPSRRFLKLVLLAAIIGAGVGLLAELSGFPAEARVERGETKDLSATAREWVEGGALLLDVRTGAEYAAGHIEGAVNIPVQELDARMAEIEPGRRVVVYCRSGHRSQVARDLLSRTGREVLDLGPMSAWR